VPVTSVPDAVRLESISGRHVGGRRITVSDQPVDEVALSSALPAYHHDPNDAYHIEQAYVQRFVPAERAQRTPVLLVHGGGMTGACWESTPDGRPGWLWAFLRAGLQVEVLDNVERGRAGWCSLPGVWHSEPILRGERDMWVTFRVGPVEGYETRTPFPGSRFPVGVLESMLRQSVPRWPANGELAAPALLDVVDDIGPCVPIGHSQGGGLCARVAAERPAVVRALVMIEPHGLPPLAAVPAGHPPGLTVLGDYVPYSPMWIRLVEEIRRHSALIRQSGAPADVLDLPARGIHGNSHNPMMDTQGPRSSDGHHQPNPCREARDTADRRGQAQGSTCRRRR
jgi:pimeloyl-ACP methyl ester carboxylesterase